MIGQRMPAITCIHGFLGHPHDWEFLERAGFDVDPLSHGEAGRVKGGDVLLGYSMGGRLALDALANGARFRRAVIVSAGLNLEEGREERRERDEAWARRFENDPWGEVVRDWNAQPLFGGHVVERLERDYDRAELARSMREHSPGVMAPLAPRLGALDLPILWIAGERDRPYVETGRRAVALLPQAALWICPEAGHRVPWEQPERFVERLRAFVKD